MKKFTILIAAIALVCFSLPAMAADWSFYGSARMATFYNSDDLGKVAPGATDKNSELAWYLQGNSRLGAKVKAESVSGQIELGLRAGQLSGNLPANGSRTWSGDEDVRTRRVYGEWKFAEGSKLKVGKDYTPMSQLLFGSIYDDDNGLVGDGAFFGGRVGQISVSFGGFEIALIEPETNILTNTGAFLGAAQGVDFDQTLPKIEAKWGMAMDTVSFNVRGGFQTFKVDNGGAATDSFNVTAYAVAGDVVANFGAFTVTGAASYSRNPGAAGWNAPGLYTWGAYPVLNTAGDDYDDTDQYQFGLSGRFAMSDMLIFEVGGGYLKNDSDVKDLKDDNVMQLYGQAVVVLAPGVYIVPEVGYYNRYNDVDGDDEGSRFYAGAKWQIDF
jgi:hypothetical protein